jgi:hypothetical protein
MKLKIKEAIIYILSMIAIFGIGYFLLAMFANIC